MDVEDTVTVFVVGVLFACMRRNVVSLDSSDVWIPPMYWRSFVNEEGRREEIQSRT